ncbi:hypothetical protein INT48_001243 [Thamnidium elegans]|uniref:Uncharacterized protein n=1 Tax=Thamnidium elegans TaxID=101142 RepID=A0A8H7SJY4_9FUNG|nr:hypothetical protein INT48_001243 [Thamnidium elegans]
MCCLVTVKLEVESVYCHASDKNVDLFYQSPHDLSLCTNVFDHKEDDLTYLIRRDDKSLEKYEFESIFKKFYAYEDCIVYATIYVFDVDYLLTEGIKTDDRDLVTIQQFERYVKRDEDNPMTVTKLEVRTDSDLGSKIHKYRLRDTLLAANIYDDRQFIEAGD